MVKLKRNQKNLELDTNVAKKRQFRVASSKFHGKRQILQCGVKIWVPQNTACPDDDNDDDPNVKQIVCCCCSRHHHRSWIQDMCCMMNPCNLMCMCCRICVCLIGCCGCPKNGIRSCRHSFRSWKLFSVWKCKLRWWIVLLTVPTVVINRGSTRYWPPDIGLGFSRSGIWQVWPNWLRQNFQPSLWIRRD